MKEFIDKLIERLEEFKKEAYDKWDGGASFGAYAMSIEIINQLAEEYKNKLVGIDTYMQVAHERDIAIEQLNELGYGFGQTIDVSELLGVSEQGNDGWIPCSERLPEEDREYNCLIFDDCAKKTFESSVLYVKQHGWVVSSSNYVVAYKPYQPKGE